jgi:hypothetical protein
MMADESADDAVLAVDRGEKLGGGHRVVGGRLSRWAWVLVGASVVAIVAAIVLGVLAASWSLQAGDARSQSDSLQIASRDVHARGVAATSEADRLRAATEKTSNAVDGFVSTLQAGNAAQGQFEVLLNAAIAQANSGDIAGSQSKLAGDGASADAEATTKTNMVHSALATLNQTLANLKATTGG